MIDIYQLVYFVAVCEEGTVSKAAERVLVSQPALSRSLQSLEKELGVPLFKRSKNRLVLNENGKYAYKEAKKILDELDDFKKNVRKEEEDHFIISLGTCAPAPVWVLEDLLSKESSPYKLESELSEEDGSLIKGLIDDKYNLLFLTHPLVQEGVISEYFLSESLYVSVTKDDPLAKRDSVTFKELDGTTFLLSSKIGFWSNLAKISLPNSQLLYQDDKAIVTLVRQTALPTFRTDLSLVHWKETNQGDKDRVTVPISDPEATLRFYAAYKEEMKDRFAFLKKASDLPYYVPERVTK